MIKSKKKQKNYRIGHYAEIIAAFYLRLKGYKILKRRYKTHNGEIDLISQKGKMLVFIEVKFRRDAKLAPYSITKTSKNRIKKAASTYLANNLNTENMPCRFDAIFITPWKFPKHIKDAWQ